MAQACYRPEAAAELWARMERSSTGQAPPQFLSTHPSNANREAKIREWIPEAQEKQEHSQCHGMLGFGMCPLDLAGALLYEMGFASFG